MSETESKTTELEQQAPSEAVQERWKTFLQSIDGAVKEAGISGLALSALLSEQVDDKTRLTSFGAAFLPNLTDVAAVRDISILLVKSAANAAANEAGRVTAASVVAASEPAPAAAPAPAQA
jgi:hypothetical protein